MANKKSLARMALLLAAIIWGSSFVVLKNTLDSLPILFILAFRFIVAGVFLSAVFWKKFRLINKTSIAKGSITGACLFLAYYIQTIGLNNTTPGKNAFLTSVYCIMVPFLFWLTDKKKPDAYNIIAALTCLTGIGLVSLTSDLTIGMGDYMTLFSGFFWAAHIVCIAKFARDCDSVLFTIIQFFACGILALLGSLAFETLPVGGVAVAWGELIYMAIFCTGITLLCQNWGQTHLPPSNAAILLTLESVFGVLFSVLLYNEIITLRLFIGFCLIFTATIISETKLSFLNIGKKEKEHD